MIKRVLPGTIAQDLMGVQPMSAPSGSVFRMNFRFGKATEQPITFKKTKVDKHWCCEFKWLGESDIESIEEWLKTYPRSDYWVHVSYSGFYVNIYDEELLTAFTLRWQNSSFSSVE